MIVLCPSCWQTVDLTTAICPHCGADVKALDQRTYTEKLIAALRHPDADTVARVAPILAKTAPGDALPPLKTALRGYWLEPYLAAAIVQALGLLVSAEARELVTDALGHESIVVRAPAAKALLHGHSEARAHARG